MQANNETRCQHGAQREPKTTQDPDNFPTTSRHGPRDPQRLQKGANMEPKGSQKGAARFSGRLQQHEQRGGRASAFSIAAVKHAEFTDYIQDIFMPEFSS